MARRHVRVAVWDRDAHIASYQETSILNCQITYQKVMRNMHINNIEE